MEDSEGMRLWLAIREIHSETLKTWSSVQKQSFDHVAFDRLVCRVIQQFERDHSLENAKQSVRVGLARMAINSSDLLASNMDRMTIHR
jgi:hypothetical protein